MRGSPKCINHYLVHKSCGTQNSAAAIDKSFQLVENGFKGMPKNTALLEVFFTLNLFNDKMLNFYGLGYCYQRLVIDIIIVLYKRI